MSDQLTIWGGSSASGIPTTHPVHQSKPLARRSDPPTSMGAAVYAMPTMAASRAKALAALTAAGPEGLTDFELEAITHVKQTSIGKRRGDLVRDDLVEALVRDGKPVRRFAPSGALAQVWVITTSRNQDAPTTAVEECAAVSPFPGTDGHPSPDPVNPHGRSVTRGACSTHAPR